MFHFVKTNPLWPPKWFVIAGLLCKRHLIDAILTCKVVQMNKIQMACYLPTFAVMNCLLCTFTHEIQMQ